MSASTHQAAVLPSQGSRLTLQNIPTSSPGPRELLISVSALALNPVDHYMRDMGIFVTTYPAVLGSDIAGVVEAVGSEIPSSTPFKPGTRVLAFATAFLHGGEPRYGGMQKKVLVPVASACVIPDGMSFIDAATLPMGIVTAWSGLTSIGLPTSSTPLFKPEDKQGLLIWGASSSVGISAIQVAKTLGYTIYATASARHHAHLTSLGASRVFDYTSPSVVEDIISAAESSGLALKTAYRATGDIQPCLNAVAAFGPGGKLASAVPLDAGTPTHANVEVQFVVQPQGEEAGAKHFAFILQEWLAPRLESGEVVPAPKARVLSGGLGAVNEALDLLRGVSVARNLC